MDQVLQKTKIFIASLLVLAVFGIVACSDSSSTKKTVLTEQAKACQDATGAKLDALTAKGVNWEDWSIDDAPEMAYNASYSHVFKYNDIANGWSASSFAGRYRADTDLTGLANHPGCSRYDVYYDKTSPLYNGYDHYFRWVVFFQFKDEVPGTLWTPENTTFDCAAKKYDIPADVEANNGDIIFLAHGNSVAPHTWEKFDIIPDGIYYKSVCPLGGNAPFPCSEVKSLSSNTREVDKDGTERDMLAELLTKKGYTVIAADARNDRIGNGADGNTPGTALNSGYKVPTTWRTVADVYATIGASTNIFYAVYIHNYFTETDVRYPLGVSGSAGGTALVSHFNPTSTVTDMRPYTNYNHNFDHGWAVPLYQAAFKALIEEYKDDIKNNNRRVVVIGHSFGVTAIRDMMRRMFINYLDDDANNYNPYAVVSKFIGLSGANHGVSTTDGYIGSADWQYRYCDQIFNMKGKVCCEMGSRASWSDDTQTYFALPNNGPERVFETPCADGLFAMGQGRDTGTTDDGIKVCGDTKLGIDKNQILYYTITMVDVAQGTQQDKYVSEDASKLGAHNGMDTACALNIKTTLQDYDTSGYLLGVNHFGSQRSATGLVLTMSIIEGTYGVAK